LVLVLVGRRISRRGIVRPDPPVSRTPIVLLCVAIVVTAAGMAQHVGSGGLAHPRYLIPVAGALATLLVASLDRIARSFLPWLVVAGMAVWTLRRVPRDIDPTSVRRPRDNGGPAPVPLRVLPGSDYWRTFAGMWIVVGVAATVAALCVMAIGARRPVVRTSAESGDIGEIGDVGG
jgi:hypothetical protein